VSFWKNLSWSWSLLSEQNVFYGYKSKLRAKGKML